MHTYTPSHSHTEIDDAHRPYSYTGDLHDVSHVFFIKKRGRFNVFIQLSKLISIIDCLYSFLDSLLEQNKGAGS